MEADVVARLLSVTRTSVSVATAQVVLIEPGEAEREVSVHWLQADDWLHWDYTVSEGGEQARHFCDGTTMVNTDSRGERIRSPVPASPSVDNPLYFCSWLAFVNGWFVEMLRPVDLLARALVSSVDVPDEQGRLRITAEPMGSEPSPYSGFALPDGRRLELILDVRRGCFTEVTVHPGDPRAKHRVAHRLTRLEPAPPG